jgi:hypothetical protein
LLRAADPSAIPALRLLARMNGHIGPIRLIDLFPGDVRAMAQAIEHLFGGGLRQLADRSM